MYQNIILAYDGSLESQQALLNCKEISQPKKISGQGTPFAKIHKPPTLRDFGFMINVDADHSVKLTLSWLEPGLCRLTFVFLGSRAVYIFEIFP
jgi:hypothetical protein